MVATRVLGVVVVLLGAVASSSAAPIGVHNTGVDAADAIVSQGALASFWTLASAPVGAVEPIGSLTYEHKNPAYAANTAVSQWVAPSATGDASATGLYVYELAFDLGGLDHTTASISGLFSSDNDGFIALNGGSPVLSLGDFDFKTMHLFSFTGGFVAGLNRIQVGVTNIHNPTAFHVQFTSASADALRVPEPASLVLVGLGLMVLAVWRRVV